MKVKNRLFLSLLAMLAVTLSGLAQAEDVRMFVRHDVADYGVLNCCQFRSTTKESFSIVNHCSKIG